MRSNMKEPPIASAKAELLADQRSVPSQASSLPVEQTIIPVSKIQPLSKDIICPKLSPAKFTAFIETADLCVGCK